MTLTEFFNKKYRERKDKDNIYGVDMSDTEFRQFMLPDIERQMRSIRDTISSIENVEGYPQSDCKKYSAWSDFKKSEPYKQWIAICNKMIQEKCRLITDFHDFCELVS